ncbi:Sugar transferase involved in LPS biosynthesis (colanic, teichoic acid) [Butyrivibrio hungatei DSM 14810]|uniref:Exopolysaccharide biosynthesis polyprenyl glycosylphosphotransferase n=2 Tax=Butyrivibrio hungatei TaxID=185008 RepID=A0A1D9P3J6_9FIRM|nr:sugar transferase [Butyrivibrio hungatei]AOZ97186.1 exopolysaccharide biosynthesis polyprenyl glycosylphosphotransferase [Butyrivibrio hungatei]SHN50413.1 Sugar transferase involved in LPS biosynthesis (colanic, teichoic acid) [Butyrivibrio hungatei DSM 14810]
MSKANAIPVSELRAGAGRKIIELNYQEIYDHKPNIYKWIKRLFDIAASSVALILLSPVFLVTALAIFLEDGGPVFFTQQRAGKDMKSFKIYKFRSMYKNAESMFERMQAQNEQTGHAFKIKNDPRVTHVGRFIRRFSIDELPQLFNIIKGDMSVVGPRPILTSQMEECNAYEKQRTIVKPGLTCYWQVCGRAKIKWDRWVELDLQYIQDMSLSKDIELIFRTFPAIFGQDGAY